MTSLEGDSLISVYQCTGIQTLGLLGRKVLLGFKAKCVRNFAVTMLKFAPHHMLERPAKDRELVGAVSVDYLMYSSYVMMGYYWSLQAAKSKKLLASGKGAESAEFYFERLLPRANSQRTGSLAPMPRLGSQCDGRCP